MIWKALVGATVTLFVALSIVRLWIAKQENYRDGREAIISMLRELDDPTREERGE
jgi:hypothetical protein